MPADDALTPVEKLLLEPLADAILEDVIEERKHPQIHLVTWTLRIVREDREAA